MKPKKEFTHGSLFSGIGGFDLAAEWMGWQNAFHCEWNEFGQKILKYYWPNAKSYEDITKTDFSVHRGQIDILTGGFPCQPYSAAGKRKGKEDDRHLWPEMLRAIREIQPTWVVGENVRGLVNWNGGMVFDEVQVDLENEGYKVQPFLLPAASVNAPHQRDRIWFIAYNKSKRRDKGDGQEVDIQEREMAESGQKRNSLRNDTGTSDKAGSGDVTNPESFGSGGIRHQSSEEGSRLRDELPREQRGISSETRDAADPASDRRTRERSGFETETRKEPGEDRELEGRSEGFCSHRNATNTNGAGRRESNKEMERGPSKQPDSLRVQQNATNATDTVHEGLQRSELNGSISKQGKVKTESRLPLGSIRADWEVFPTQPPICNGNDGVSFQLDGITIPKWRNESIKAGGNAIVPQVAHQIFKAIEEYKNQNHNR